MQSRYKFTRSANRVSKANCKNWQTNSCSYLCGRSLLLEPILPFVDSVLYAWHVGTMVGPAIADLILGNISPSRKLPVTFLRAVKQIPLYYNKKNTGRPNNSSSYIDIDSTPLFPFGFGLSYG